IYGPDGKFIALLGGPSDADGVITINPVDTASSKYSKKFTQKGVYNATAFYDQEPSYKGKFTLFDYSEDGSPVSPSAADLMNPSSPAATTTTPTPTTTPPTTTTTTPPVQPPLQPPKIETPKTETTTQTPKDEQTASSPPAEKPTSVIPGFPDPTKDPQTYVDRYNNEPAFKELFDNYFPGKSIYEIVGLPEPVKVQSVIPGFPDPTKDPQTYVDRYNNEPAFKEWFDKYFPGKSIYEVVGLPEPKVEAPQVGVCGEGTALENGVCVVTKKSGGGCLVATAAYGTELAPQVQGLREIRDGVLLKSDSGSRFMDGFNAFYYSFSPTVADWERQSPLFKDVVKTTLTPLLSSLSILNFAHADSEQELLGYGAGIIMLNVGMYFALPAFVILQIRKRLH
ncbi:MAG TPA: CFI-box-CTERM domain-containing protein, partial [Candidatus Nitrosotenuis sp.]|nr:CFI-box-CTERM domain-containing protein [Candidatus Nitrosotenuis sp.]